MAQLYKDPYGSAIADIPGGHFLLPAFWMGMRPERLLQNFLNRKAETMGAAQKLALYIENNQERFYRTAYTYVKNREDALDIVHNAIVKALQSYDRLRNPEYAQTWFYRILVNESLSFLRRNRRILSFEELPPPQLPSDESLSEMDRDAYIDLYAAVDKLPPDMKTIVILHFFEDMKLAEVAEITSTNLNTVKSRLYRALKHLKVDMEVVKHDG